MNNNNEKMWCIHAIECYSGIKINEVLKHATTQMNIENAMLIIRSQSQKTHMVTFHLYEMSR